MISKWNELSQMHRNLPKTRGRYKLNKELSANIESAINNAGTFMQCLDYQDAISLKVKYREVIREHYPNDAHKITVSVYGNGLFLWNKETYKTTHFSKKIFNQIIERGRISVSTKYINYLREGELEKIVKED